MNDVNMVGFHYGALSKPLEEQAKEQGYTLGKEAERLEHYKDAIITLIFGEILTDSQRDKAFQKLNKRVSKALKPLKDKAEI